jgi:hypothetical protein
VIDDPHERLLTRDQAAAAAHVSPKTIDTWVHRGRLQSAADGPLYREMDVLLVERATRQAPRLRRLVASAAKVKHHLQQETCAQGAEPPDCPNRINVTELGKAEPSYLCGCQPDVDEQQARG